MKHAIVVDVDGTVADGSHRQHHLDRNDWGAFFADMHLDSLYEHTKIMVDALRNDGYYIVIVTARPDENDYREKTVDWLKRHDIEYDAIYMRRAGDYRKDSIVKREILDQMMEDGYLPVLALDDRTQVVEECWRASGIPCAQVNPDNTIRNKSSKYIGQPLFHMLVGPSGAGKSTWVEAQIKAGKFKESDVISSDKVRDELFGGHESGQGHTQEDLARTWRYIHKLIEARLSEGLVTVLDSTALKRKDRLETMKYVPDGIITTYHVIDREYNEKVKTRGWRPEKLIDKHHKSFKSGLKDILRGDDQPYTIVDDDRIHKI